MSLVGVLDLLSNAVQSNDSPIIQGHALLCLSELAFSNIDVKRSVFNTPGLIATLSKVSSPFLFELSKFSSSLRSYTNW